MCWPCHVAEDTGPQLAFDLVVAPGAQHIAGVDEAGRGPLAGPVVVAAVVFASGRTPINGLDDSKQLSASRREALYARIVDRALAWHVVSVEVEEIDRIIRDAGYAPMRRRQDYSVIPEPVAA